MKRILIIEDDQLFRENLAELLCLTDYEVICASDGKSGIEKALKENPDLIICDISMPAPDGYAVLHILSRHPETASIPFIFLSGKNELIDLRKGMGMGADDYLVKPVDEHELLDSIEMRLKKSMARDSRSEYRGINSFFVSSESTQKTSFISNKEINKYKKKHILHSNDQTPKFVYFVLSGKLKEYFLNEENKELITNIYSKGDFIGYKELFDNIKYTHNVQVMEDSELMLIPKNEFIQLIDNDKAASKDFITLLCRVIREQDERLINLAYNSLRKKVANAIIQITDKFKDKREGKPSIEISREDLAHLIGSAPESMIRVLKEFKHEKLIEVLEGYIVVLNENKLRNLLY